MSLVGDIAKEILRKTLYDFALKAAIAKAIQAAPFLGWPVINPLFVFVMNRFAGLLFEEMKTRVDFTVIDFETEKERKAYEEAVAELQKLSALPEPPSEEDVERAREELRRRLGELVRFKPR